MTVHIGTLETEVSVEAPASGSGTGTTDAARHGMEWQERVRIAAIRALLLRDELRTRATGHDD